MTVSTGALAVSAVCGVFLHLATASASIRMARSMMKDPDRKYAGAHPVYNVLQALLILCFPLAIAAFMLFAVFNTK